MRTSPKTVLKSVGPKLVPFFKTVAIFFVLFPTEDKDDSIFFCVVKILPIISLMLFVLLHGMNFSDAYAYSRKVLIGLVFSMIGDICLVWKSSFFLVGIGAFGIAQLSYACAFGFSPIKPISAAVLTAVGCVVYSLLLPGLEGPLVLLTACYVALICFMGWRAAARVQFFEDDWTWNDDLWTWTKMCGCLGALFFSMSDLTIAVNMFSFTIPYSHPIIMLTYYAAQLGITLSVVDSQVDCLLSKTKRDVNGVNHRNGVLH